MPQLPNPATVRIRKKRSEYDSPFLARPSVFASAYYVNFQHCRQKLASFFHLCRLPEIGFVPHWPIGTPLPPATFTKHDFVFSYPRSSAFIGGHQSLYYHDRNSKSASFFQIGKVKDFLTTNGIPAKGGAMVSTGATIADGMLFVNSGGSGMAANVLLAFSAQ